MLPADQCVMNRPLRLWPSDENALPYREWRQKKTEATDSSNLRATCEQFVWHVPDQREGRGFRVRHAHYFALKRATLV